MNRSINISRPTPKPIARLLISVLLMILFSAATLQPAASQGIEIEFGETNLENHFPKGIKFSVKIDIDNHRGIVYFHYRLGSDLWTKRSANCLARTINSGLFVESYSCIFFLDLENIPPQLPISYRWQLYGTVDRSTEVEALVYGDPNFEWHSLEADRITIWWHDRSQEFAEQVLSTAKTALQNQEPLFGKELVNPIQIVVENSLDEYTTWSHGITYTVGGQAFPRYGSTIQIVNLEERWQGFWLNEVIPHEISHLYFFQVSGREQAKPPNWLNEGIAGYNEPNHSTDWRLVRQAVWSNALIPLGDLREGFEGAGDEISLSYAESMTAIEYIVETYGEGQLRVMFSEYQNYKSSDEAFQTAFGHTVSEVETDWETWVKEKSSLNLPSAQILVAVLVMILGCSCSSLLIPLGFIFYFNRPTQPKPAS